MENEPKKHFHILLSSLLKAFLCRPFPSSWMHGAWCELCAPFLHSFHSRTKRTSRQVQSSAGNTVAVTVKYFMWF